MERYILRQLYTVGGYNLYLASHKTDILTTYSSMLMGLDATQLGSILDFALCSIWHYFKDDLVTYQGEDVSDVKSIFMERFDYEIAVKLPYWYRKYNYIKDLLTSEDLSLLQTSKMTSSSSDTTKSAGGTLQKTATTPTGVSSETTPDEINIDIKTGSDDGDNDIETNGFADKYSNAQQKFANASRVEGERSGEILREGSIEELLKVLEKLPSSFANEVCLAVQNHFIFDYDGEMKHIY